MTAFPLQTAEHAEKFITDFGLFATAHNKVISAMTAAKLKGAELAERELDEVVLRACAEAGIAEERFNEIAALDFATQQEMLAKAADLIGLSRAGRRRFFGPMLEPDA